ncbi:hypothetical protein OROGR_025116 [Orobanche gracilis]
MLSARRSLQWTSFILSRGRVARFTDSEVKDLEMVENCVMSVLLRHSQFRNNSTSVFMGGAQFLCSISEGGVSKGQIVLGSPDSAGTGKKILLLKGKEKEIFNLDEKRGVEDLKLVSLVLLICVTKVAKSAFDKALVEHEDVDDAVGSEEPTDRDHGVDLQQPLLIKIDSFDSHQK